MMRGNTVFHTPISIPSSLPDMSGIPKAAYVEDAGVASAVSGRGKVYASR